MKKNKPRLFDKIKDMNAVDVPYNVWNTFGDDRNVKQINYNSWGEVCLGGDYKSIPEARKTIEWYVNQLGGKVKWEKENGK